MKEVSILVACSHNLTHIYVCVIVPKIQRKEKKRKTKKKAAAVKLFSFPQEVYGSLHNMAV